LTRPARGPTMVGMRSPRTLRVAVGTALVALGGCTSTDKAPVTNVGQVQQPPPAKTPEAKTPEAKTPEAKTPEPEPEDHVNVGPEDDPKPPPTKTPEPTKPMPTANPGPR
jgi:hypothetical protein